ncbi:hypothetical protein HU200_035757 [Digitaria exilis]|uniref:Uncharacterized protein n=1 Tax=Digitaria exilis TaxID=1010633 RepID=A0A835BT42_9POAL|nr:hypothetical protein HU200_035757 [Digitaria exilis]
MDTLADYYWHCYFWNKQVGFKWTIQTFAFDESDSTVFYSAPLFVDISGMNFVPSGIPLARMGATVTAIDAVGKNIKIASIHAASDPATASIEYCCTTAGSPSLLPSATIEQ